MRELSEHDKALVIDGIPEDNLVLFCPGLQGKGGTLIDRSKNANNGTISGATWAATKRGLRVLSFDGSNDYVDFLTPASLTGLTAITVEAWVNPTTLKNSRIISKWASEWNLSVRSVTDELTFSLYGSTGAATLAYDLAAGVWTFIAVTWATPDTSVKFYKNGSLKETTAFSINPGTPTGGTTKVVLGQSSALDNTLVFNGEIFPPRVYSRVLTLAEISSHYNRERHLFGV